MDNIRVDQIQVYAKAGSTLNPCIQDAIELSMKEGRDVQLTHNEVVYYIRMNDVIEKVRNLGLIDHDRGCGVSHKGGLNV
jgi:hypothetical protein